MAIKGVYKPTKSKVEDYYLRSITEDNRHMLTVVVNDQGVEYNKEYGVLFIQDSQTGKLRLCSNIDPKFGLDLDEHGQIKVEGVNTESYSRVTFMNNDDKICKLCNMRLDPSLAICLDCQSYNNFTPIILFTKD